MISKNAPYGAILESGCTKCGKLCKAFIYKGLMAIWHRTCGKWMHQMVHFINRICELWNEKIA